MYKSLQQKIGRKKSHAKVKNYWIRKLMFVIKLNTQGPFSGVKKYLLQKFSQIMKKVKKLKQSLVLYFAYGM